MTMKDSKEFRQYLVDYIKHAGERVRISKSTKSKDMWMGMFDALRDVLSEFDSQMKEDHMTRGKQSDRFVLAKAPNEREALITESDIDNIRWATGLIQDSILKTAFTTDKCRDLEDLANQLEKLLKSVTESQGEQEDTLKRIRKLESRVDWLWDNAQTTE